MEKPSRNLCLIHNKLTYFPESKLFYCGLHTASVLLYLVYNSFYIARNPKRFLDMRRLSYKQVIWKATKISGLIGGYYCTGLYLILYNEDLKKKQKIRDQIMYELLRRNSYMSKEC